MASGRFLSTSIADDTRLGKLSMTAEYLYLKTIPHLDRDGMVSGRAGLLWGRVCPLRDDLIGEMQSAVNEWVNAGLVVRFFSEDEPVLFFPGFLKNNNLPHYNRERPSRFPAPPGFSHTKTGLLLLDSVNEPVNEQLLDEVQELVQDSVMDEVQDFPLQEQEQEEEEEEVKDQDQEQQGDEEEDAHASDPANDAWQENYGENIPANLRIRIDNLVTECGANAVAYAIHASKDADARNFRYIAQCARNYIPAAPAANGNGYNVDIPGVHVLAPLQQPTPAAALSPPMQHDDPWVVALAEILPTLTPHAAGWLKGSSLHENGELAGVPFYRVTVQTEAGNVGWLNQKVGTLIRKTLSSILHKRIEVEIVASELEPTR